MTEGRGQSIALRVSVPSWDDVARNLGRERIQAYGRVLWANEDRVSADPAPFEWSVIGPMVRARRISAEGRDAWQTIAVTTRPRSYVATISACNDETGGNRA